MSADDRSRPAQPKKHRHRNESWPESPRAKAPPRGWTSKTMHHPATRIGEIKHGKS